MKKDNLYVILSKGYYTVIVRIKAILFKFYLIILIIIYDFLALLQVLSNFKFK